MDSAKRAKHFSLFNEDTLPAPKEIVEVKKNKYGVMEKMSFRKKTNTFNKIYMEVIYPELSDSAIHKNDSIPMMAGDSLSMLN